MTTYKREPNTQYILSLSYGKDSLACLEAIKLLGLPLDRIVHAEVWATDTIPADLPPMVDFKAKADKIILDRYGINVEHIYATREVERERERESHLRKSLLPKIVLQKTRARTNLWIPVYKRGVVQLASQNGRHPTN